MPRFTENFNLTYATSGEIITDEMEENRFQNIDRQLGGLFQALGNGVIEGWNVSKGSENLSLNISPGKGLLNLKYLESNISENIDNIDTNTQLILAVSVLSISPFELAPNFFLIEIDDFNPESFLKLAIIRTNSNSIFDIDESVRNNIKFVQDVLDAIKNHKHIGGTDNPSKIDLSSQVTGELKNENLGDLDAKKITSGRLDSSLIPKLDHNELQNIGSLTHEQLDSFVKMITFENSHLTGEIASTNLLQMYLAMKHVWSDIDKYTSNLISIIPGISSDSFTDIDNTSANIDFEDHVIKGILPLSGTSLEKIFQTNNDFKNYHFENNIKIKNNQLKINEVSNSEKIIVDFENSSQNEQDIPGFEKSITTLSDSTSFKSTINDVDSGFFAGKIKFDQIIKLSFKKSFDSPQNWTKYDTLSISVKSSSLSHPQINFAIYNDGNEQTPITLLNQNEITDGFKNISVALSNFNVDKVNQIEIFTDTSLGWEVDENFEFILDNIKIQADSLFEDSANIRYRISLPQKAKWSSASWISEENEGLIKVRGRSAKNDNTLDFTPFSNFLLNSGDTFDIEDNPEFELDIQMFPSNNNKKTPTIDMIKVKYVVPSSENGFFVDSKKDWEQGEPSSKINIDSSGSIKINEPISVGDIIYSNNNFIAQITPINIPTFGNSGNLVPNSPYFVMKSKNNTNNFSGFNFVTSMKNLNNGNYIFCDTDNDRVFELDRNGNFIWGLGSVNKEDEEFSILSSVLNEDILYIVLSKKTNFSSINLNQIRIITDEETIILGTDDQLIEDEFIETIDDTKFSQIIRIKLSLNNFVKINEYDNLKLAIKEDAFEDEISSSFDISSIVSNSGINIFKGNFYYIQGIFQPINITLLENENFVIGNAKQWGKLNEGFNSIIEVNRSGDIIFTYDKNNFTFSIQTLGGISEYNENTLLAAGIVGEASNAFADDVEIKSVNIHAGDEKQDNYLINTGEFFRFIADVKVENSDGNLVPLLGNKIEWSTSNTSVATIDTDGLMKTISPGKVKIFANIEGVEDFVSVEVGENIENPSVSTASLSPTEKDIVNNAQGKVILIDKNNLNSRFTYNSPDNFYPSSVAIEKQNDLFVISEKNLLNQRLSRVIKIDTDSNVLFEFGEFNFENLNSVRSLSNNDIILSS